MACTCDYYHTCSECSERFQRQEADQLLKDDAEKMGQDIEILKQEVKELKETLNNIFDLLNKTINKR